MSKTFAVKALERASGEKDVVPGQIVDAYPDLYMSHTASWRCIRTLERMGVEKLFDPDRIAMVMDHVSPGANGEDGRRPPTVAGIRRQDGRSRTSTT